jgi:hypothetical protein
MSRHLPLLLALALPTALLGCTDGDGATKKSSSAKSDEAAKSEAAPLPPFDRASAKTPWARCKVGDWAEYKNAKGETLRFEVTEVGDDTLSFSAAKDGSPLGDNPIDLREEERRYQPPRSYDSQSADPVEQTVTVAGKEVQVIIIKRANSNGSSTESWFAEADVPPFVQCMVKSIRNDKLEYDLLDFGRGE